jgi:feruloyl esterase
MLATYPEVFAGGAIIAGLPYGCARNVQEAFEAMFTEQQHAVQALGDRVHTASRHCGPWPKVSIWHGTSDPIVKPSNGEDILRQWTNVHGLHNPYQESIGLHVRRVWSDASGEPLIEAFSVVGMAHGVPLATTGEESCGSTGAFFLDVGISSTHHIARFWRLHEALPEMARIAAPISAPIQIATEGRGFVVAGAAAERSHNSAEGSRAGGEARRARYPLDPNAAIAMAFKAAGLPLPEMPAPKPGAEPRVTPGPIIAAALKAAGLVIHDQDG